MSKAISSDGKAGLKNPTLPPFVSSCMNNDSKTVVVIGSQCRATAKVRELAHRKVLYLSSKQTPSCLILKGTGWPSLRGEHLETLVAAGFPVQQQAKDGSWHSYVTEHTNDWHQGVSVSQVDAFSHYLSSVVEYNDSLSKNLLFESDMPSGGLLELREDASDDGFFYEGASETDFVETESCFEEENPTEKRSQFRLRCSDPFETLAAIRLCTLEKLPQPKVLNCFSDVKRLQDNIPYRCLGKHWNGKVGRGIPFYKIANVKVKLHVLSKHTHWGSALMKCIHSNDPYKVSFGKSLWRMLKHFLEGKPNPSWSKALVRLIYGEEYTLRSQKSRGVRLIQTLLTIDGIMIQKLLSYPELTMTWESYDIAVLGNLYLLLGDEFLDGEINNYVFDNAELNYKALKDLREAFKDACHHEGSMTDLLADRLEHPICHQFLYVYSCYARERDRRERLQVEGILCQKRGMGTPPPLQVLRDKVKTLKTLTDKPEPLPSWKRSLIVRLGNLIVSELPDEPFTGLATKAGVTVTTSSCYEYTGRERGTAQAIKDIVWEGKHLGRPIKIIDLNSGAFIENKLFDDVTPGEFIFWTCLEYCLSFTPDELRKCMLISAREPSKSRTVTKGRACLKIVLNVVNGICSWPLAKGFESSESGMLKEAHGWNLFKKLTGSWKDIVFDIASSTKEQLTPGSFLETRSYKQVYTSSTDYKTATDWERHDVASIFGNIWMTKCGIPNILKGIVNCTCYRPRQIEFYAEGILRQFGEKTDVENIRFIRTERGVLMGDPLTKPVLHLINIATRILGSALWNRDDLGKLCSNPSQVAERLARTWQDLDTS